MRFFIPVLLAALLSPLAAQADGLPRSAAPAAAEVYFIAPLDGATVGSEVLVQFGLKGMGVAPAGTALANTGHHHLLIDTGLPALDQPVPADAQHVHFGKGQTETTITLSPGTHTLQLLLADQNHIPHVPAVVSKAITITVK
ncbi:MAG: rod shape-determining protein RodA [Lysobacterales bacterium CG17_big_fil_post_rev_8_21_14_2_50_64_11]|nr:MAG: rod shape-determining protein RodA [Xanthomonadales bacterium CG17_big_fil_post_rev_8_21_14_2_50_64_11]PIX61626.1 MAG: rod shape-determining protein RodA [Xanthomonadales bacterium CG_4_10_14_3_um_filter_64_11]